MRRTLPLLVLTEFASPISGVSVADGPVVEATSTATSRWRSGLEGRYTLKDDTIAVPVGRKVEFDLSADTPGGSFPDTMPNRGGRHLTFTTVGRNGAAALTPLGNLNVLARFDATIDPAPPRGMSTRLNALSATADRTEHLQAENLSGTRHWEITGDDASPATFPDNGLR